MSKLTKTTSSTKWLSLAAAIYVLLFLATRLINITSFPLFIDEVTHIFRVQSTLAGDFFIGLRGGGKQLYIWLVAVSFQFFDDPILAARVISVLAALISGGICYKLTEMLYPHRRISYLAALFYLISPFALLYDRMALTDSLLAMLMGASLLFSFQLWRYPSIRWALVTGIVFGLAALTKGYAALYYPAPILFWLLFGKNISWGKIIKLLLVTYAIAFVAWIPIVITGQQIYHEYLMTKSIAGSAESDFLIRFWQASLLLIEWLSTYLTFPLVGLLIFTVLRMIIKRNKAGFALILLVFGPLLIFALTLTDLHSRYLLFVIVPLSVMVAWGVDDLVKLILPFMAKIRPKSRFLSNLSPLVLQVVVFLIFCIPSFFFSYLIITEPSQAPFPEKDKQDYIINAQSAQGYKEIAELIEELTQRYSKVIFLRYALPSPLEKILGVYLPDRVLERMDFVEIRNFNQVTPQSLNSYAIQAPTLTVQNELITSGNEGDKTYVQLWPIASFSSKQAIYQWLVPPDFAIHWFQQAGDTDPRIVWVASEALVTATGGTLLDWSQFSKTTPEAVQQALTAADIEYVLATPALISHQPALFASFITTDGTTLRLKQLPPGWRLAFAYPELNCQWCLFQLKPPDYPTNITFGEVIELAGYDLSTTQLSTDESLYITLYWQSLASLSESYVVFVHLLDENGRLVGQVDELPLQGKWLTNYWQTGDSLADRHTLRLDSGLPAGDYTISIGLYNPTSLARMPARSEQNLVMDNAVTLTTISLGDFTSPARE